MCDNPPFYLKTESDHPPSLCIIIQDINEDLEGDLEEYPLESDPEIRLHIDLDYDSYSIPLYYSLSFITGLQP